MKRRKVLRLGGLAATGLVAGCTGRGVQDDEPSSTATTASTSTSTTTQAPTSTTTRTATESTTSTTVSVPTGQIGDTLEAPKFRLTVDWLKRKNVVKTSQNGESYELPDGKSLALAGLTVENTSDEHQSTLDAYPYIFADGEYHGPASGLPFDDEVYIFQLEASTATRAGLSAD